MIQQIDESHYIAVLVTKTKIQMNCTNTDLQLISGNYLITVPFQCQFKTEDQTFSNNRLISESQPLLLPNIVIPYPDQEEIPEVHIEDVQLDKIHLVKKKQEEIKSLILKNPKVTTPFNFWNISIILLIIIIFAYFAFEYQCTLEGIKCLNEYYNEISVLKASWSNRTGLVCGCLPSCNEIELSVIRDDKVGIINDFAVVELTLERLPTERFKRNVVRGKLDLVGMILTKIPYTLIVV
ncbi:unnamed protein product [Diabrotica balteata]|uniref:Uncharacterized protein n=1 Tax=Diabrotica balteata TaxID=107213 RepID=A0A9N9X934_DIABA|nr:unnamed protein product [Diabrotica balteata]